MNTTSIKSEAVSGALRRIANHSPSQLISFSPREISKEEMKQSRGSGERDNYGDNYDDHNDFPDAPYPD